jgi:hypothetical protein
VNTWVGRWILACLIGFAVTLLLDLVRGPSNIVAGVIVALLMFGGLTLAARAREGDPPDRS